MKVTKRLKELEHLRVPEELCAEVCDIVTGTIDEYHPQEKEMQKGKMVV